ncbi:hypothetical protein QR98_0025540 [Sarcoptes scabiei]|uniref:Uncharacterized protein n=1 Tax=Sarcoptes scabiei TaxID=52283 RepID=A0A131ZZK1_SARSC|nr:hypothetical protein QR98_0025540 [Sarcoptes scabiei]
MKKELQKLIEEGEKASEKAHEKLQQSNINMYSMVFTQELEYMEMLVRRCKAYLTKLPNPFLRKLILYAVRDLRSMLIFMKNLQQMFNEGQDPSMPTLTRLIREVIEQANLDVIYLTSINCRGDAGKISNEMKDRMFGLKMQDLNKLVKKLVKRLAKFTQLVLDIERVNSFNMIYY